MKWACVVLAAALAMAALPAPAGGFAVGPGGIRVHGYSNAYGGYNLDITYRQDPVAVPRVLAVKVYAEPSHKLLGAYLDESAMSTPLMTSIQDEKPAAMAIGGGFGNGETITLGIPPPSQDDATIRVDYVSLSNGKPLAKMFMEVSVTSLLDFDVSASPEIGGFRCCGFCGGDYCGCVQCPTASFHMCCPGCTIACGVTSCPP